jgi:tocopherol O-methyltransferase
VSKYVQLADKLGLKEVKTDDWSQFVAPFWPAVFFSALVPKNFFRMIRSGWTTIKGAIATVSQHNDYNIHVNVHFNAIYYM